MKNKMLVVMAVIFTMVAMVGNSFAWEGCGRKGKMMGDGLYGQDFTQLTDDQKSKLKALHQKFIDETATVRASMLSKHEEIKILMETTTPDKAKLHALSAEVIDLQKQVMDKKIDMSLDAKKIAPEIDIAMGFGKHGMAGCSMGGGCEMMGGRGCEMMGGHGSMMKGMGKMNCPAMAAPADETAPKDTKSKHK